jgi:hypothetical protein
MYVCALQVTVEANITGSLSDKDYAMHVHMVRLVVVVVVVLVPRLR